MNIRSWRIAVPCLLAIGAHCALGQAPAWSHDPGAVNGPLHWGSVASTFATCGNVPFTSSTPAPVGMAQSPVDIETATSVLAALPNIRFDYTSTPFEVENTGHVAEVVYAAGSSIRLGPALTDIYQLVQFHFHAPSEHTINGTPYDAELHLVHSNALGQLAVIGVLLSMSPTAPAGDFDNIVATAPLIPGTGEMEGLSLNARTLLPPDLTYFTYAGSLTTPPCTEGVRWMVMQTSVPVSAFVIQQLHLLASQLPGYNGYSNNNRPVNPLNSRTVLLAY